MKKSEYPISISRTDTAETPKASRHLDYAAWVDSDGREHLITRDMVDSMIAELVSGPDNSLQGRGSFNTGRRALRYSQSRPHWGE
ncbi:MAG TPA: hypothetical protein VFX02_12525 [Gammaproteobacteria bacterium]|nr:hypothetical protein [Gammaproteobacteria bacterium]